MPSIVTITTEGSNVDCWLFTISIKILRFSDSQILKRYFFEKVRKWNKLVYIKKYAYLINNIYIYGVYITIHISTFTFSPVRKWESEKVRKFIHQPFQHPLTVCTPQQQPSSNLQASKQSRSERKNTQRECMFLLSDADCSRPKGVNLQKQL